jgi:hypothetical protein
MPEVTYTGGGHYRVAGEGFDPDETRDVDAELADYLADHDDFAVEGDAGADDDDADSEGDEAEPESDDEFDLESFLGRTPVDDVADDIHAGEVDEHLDAIDEAADRVTVRDAIGERRAELEG